MLHEKTMRKLTKDIKAAGIKAELVIDPIDDEDAESLYMQAGRYHIDFNIPVLSPNAKFILSYYYETVNFDANEVDPDTIQLWLAINLDPDFNRKAPSRDVLKKEFKAIALAVKAHKITEIMQSVNPQRITLNPQGCSFSESRPIECWREDQE